MSEMILDSVALPEPLFQLVRSDKVKVSEENGRIYLTPVLNVHKKGYPLRGSAADCGFTVDEFLVRKRAAIES